MLILTKFLHFRITLNFDAAFRSVPLGEDLCRAFYMLNFGGKLPPGFLNNSTRVVLERFKKVCKKNSGIVNCFYLLKFISDIDDS